MPLVLSVLFHPINGKDKKEVIAIRRLEDIRKIEAILPQIRNVVVIGGGVLGLEAAWEMKKAKCHVTVLEAAPLLMEDSWMKVPPIC